MSNSKRPASIDINHRSTKRRKPIHSDNTPLYSTRKVPWNEQRQLPEKFHRDGEHVWPAVRILQEGGTRKKKQYLVEWEPHPTTGEVFRPTWEPASNIGEGLKAEWEQGQEVSTEGLRACSTRSVSRQVSERKRARTASNIRRDNNRRIVPDSSEQTTGQLSESRTPTLVASSPTSVATPVSPIEISETQQPVLQTALAVNLPGPPADKSEYESVAGSQYSALIFGGTQTSPVRARADTPQGSRPSTSIGSHTTSINTGSGLSSLRSFRSRGSSLRASQAPQRILSYESQVEVPDSIPNSGQLLIPSARTQSSGQQVVHESSPRTERSDRSIQIVAPPASEISSQTAAGGIRVAPRNGPRKSTPEISSQSPKFKTQITFVSQPLDSEPSSQSLHTINRSVSNGTSPTLSQTTRLAEGLPHKLLFKPKMAARTTRQSPRLQATIPSSGSSPRVAVRTGNNRNRIVTMAPEISSPLATSAPEFPAENDSLGSKMSPISPTTSRDFAMSFPELLDDSDLPPATIPPSDMHLDPTAHLNSPNQNGTIEMSYGSITMPIQQSIEEEQGSSNEDMSLESKASSSQDSLKNERPVPQTDGMLMPSYPILGEDEYCIALPAEGKVQAIYQQTLKVKRKSILKFIHRRGSVNTAGTSTTKTIERNSMLELVQRLHDTTTHTDLGLPGIPTQYTIPSQEHAAYAHYAGSKFMFLGFLVDNLIRRDCTIAILSNPGPTHDLLEEFLHLKKVEVHRHAQVIPPSQHGQNQISALKVELLSTQVSTPVSILQPPSLVIAFDASFDTLNPQLKHMRAQSPAVVPVVHLIVTNSSEHVERCLPASMPSPLRLKTLVRATYQAQDNLGGTPTYVPNSDTEELHAGRPINLAELNKTIRKSPQRKLAMVAAILAATTLSNDFQENWTLGDMPPLVFEDLEEDSPSSKESRAVSLTPITQRARSNTPLTRTGVQAHATSRPVLSRTNTPNTRKRLLDVDGTAIDLKRQRMTPVAEVHPSGNTSDSRVRIEELERQLNTIQAELVVERNKRMAAEEARVLAEHRQEEWRASLAGLQRRYEKRMKQSHILQKGNEVMLAAIENGKARVEKLNTDATLLRDQLVNTKLELVTAREDLKGSGGDIAVLELARSDARLAVTQVQVLEKSLNNIKRDFDFTRSQYQDASNRAVEFASKITGLETENAVLRQKASDEARNLKELNFKSSTQKHLSKIEQLELEKRTREVLLKKQDEEIKGMKRNRGVQTRGSSAQPPGSPGPRSRQGSPVLGHVAAVGSRASALRHER